MTLDAGQIFSSLAEISYNGIEIYNVVKSKVTGTPVYSDNGITLKYTQYTFEIDAIVHPDAYHTSEQTTDQAMEEIRRRLEEPRKAFRYVGKGFGDNLKIDVPAPVGGTVDVTYGPRPQVLVFETYGGNGKAARINWTVEVCVVNCSNFIGNLSVLEFWSKISISINRKGFQTLTRTGKLELPGFSSTATKGRMARSEFKNLITNYFNTNTTLPGYHVDQKYDFSNDDRSCNFTLTYEEIESPNAYPLGVVDISFSHKASSELMSSNQFRTGFKSWENSANCRIELRPGVPSIRAWDIFTLIIAQRLAFDTVVFTKVVKKKVIVTKVRVPIVLSLDVEEEMFDYTASFSITWVSFVETISDIVQKRGLFKPLNDVSWDVWTVDLRTFAANPSGAKPIAGLDNRLTLVTPCDLPTGSEGYYTNKNEPGYVQPLIYTNQCPSSESSYITYDNEFTVTTVPATSTHRRYPTAEQVYRSSPVEDGVTMTTTPGTNLNMVGSDYEIQDLGNDKIFIGLRGSSIRLGNPTIAPSIKEYGGRAVKLVPRPNQIKSKVVSSSGNCPTYKTEWDILYEVLGSPAGDLEANRLSSGETGDYV